MRLLSMCLVKKTSGVGPRRARRCVSNSSRFRAVTDCPRLCAFTREPIISICCPAIAEAAIAHLTSCCLPENQTGVKSCGALRGYEQRRECYCGKGVVMNHCLAPDRRWDKQLAVPCCS